MLEEGRAFNLYKGLQKPLVFKSFKGKFIYWGVGSILFGLILTMLAASILNLWYGILTCTFVMGGGLVYTGIMQKKGLHAKRKDVGIFIVPNHYYRHVKKRTI
ncbi:DUF4133 domain-containing protein (plasmid) [Chondrinema litorale]|nr:DUF4133 domain-containing protein [Chondrinema litorale]UZS00031.1 DUF4133 domain-containing protein [Chondrinema litorale]